MSYVCESIRHLCHSRMDRQQSGQNPRVLDLWANGIASEINQCANLEQDIACVAGLSMKPGYATRAAI